VCLCASIAAILVEQRLRDAFETGATINVPDLVTEITESLADVIGCSAPLVVNAPFAKLIAEEAEKWGRWRPHDDQCRSLTLVRQDRVAPS